MSLFIYQQAIYTRATPDGSPDLESLISITPQQADSLLRKIGQYGSFPEHLELAFKENTVIAKWNQPNITLGIEPDGYTHS